MMKCRPRLPIAFSWYYRPGAPPATGFWLALVAAIVVLSTAPPLEADVIYLTDGTKIETPRAWEENGIVKFYLQGTDNIIISYSADIVDRIVSGKQADGPVQPAQDASAEMSTQAANGPPAGPNGGQPDPSSQADAGRSGGRDSAGPGPSAAPGTPFPRPNEPAPQMEADTGAPSPNSGKFDGIAFYDPRREFKYWSGDRSHHNTLKAAIDALAIQFNRSPEWVEQNMGDTNDLGQIYRNLNSPRTQAAAKAAGSQIKTDGILFYNPRRPYKYWVSQTKKFNTFKEAVAALSKQFNATPEWVKANMGDTNDLGEIHKNLMEGQIRESGEREVSAKEKGIPEENLQ